MRVFCLALLCAVLTGCAGPLTGGSSDQEKWQGTWKLVSATESGEPRSGDLEWVVDGDHYNIVLDQLRHTDPYNLKLDPRHNRVDVFHHETPPGTYGGKLKGIYKVSADSLAICFDLTGSYYPDSFDAGPGSRRVIYQFQRER
jgi:uncharacterized protein (TIGR03067 family)